MAAQVSEDIEELRFNTGISAMMEFINGAYKWDVVPHAAVEPFVLLLAPYAPHLAEELWQVSTKSAEYLLHKFRKYRFLACMVHEALMTRVGKGTPVAGKRIIEFIYRNAELGQGACVHQLSHQYVI